MDEQEILNAFGFNYKVERMKQKLTQDNIMEKTGFSKSYISNVENGKHNISLINALKLAETVHKNIEDLLYSSNL